MRTHALLATSLPWFLLQACTGKPIQQDTDDTAIGIDESGTIEEGEPDISVDPLSLDLGDVAPGALVQGTIAVQNVGDGPLEAAASTTSPFSLDVTSVAVEAGETSVVTVSFASATEGVYSAQAQFLTNDPDEGTVTVYLSANVTAGAVDGDGDGFVANDDCDDDDAYVNPDATETYYDGVDQNCDGASDYDADGDGHDAAEYAGDDCDDADAAISPDAAETWYDGIDENCDSRSDYDQDGDGYEAADYGGDDCDDTSATVSPGSFEDTTNGIDDDCDTRVDEPLGSEDLDGDGYSELDGDCNDADITINPAATEVWYDGLDQDCTGTSDYDADADGYDASDYGGDDCLDSDATINPGAAETWYDGVDTDCSGGSDYDADGDGHDSVDYGGDDCLDTDATVYTGATDAWYDGIDSNCDGADDYDADADGFDSADHGGDDCDDADALVNPGTAETWYDGIDADCDGASDYDADADGYDSSDYGGEDCDDADATINPAASDTWYDGIDSNCDGLNDYDQDGDGYDSAEGGGFDCDDTDATVNPAATEVYYDGVDQDCSGTSDYDQDADGVTSDDYGGFDCDDTDAAVSPSISETCDGVDNDCDGTVDDGVLGTYYSDGDHDGYGLTSRSTTGCTAPAGYASSGGDCDDSLSAVNPGASETCNSRDDDCDGSVDDGVMTTWYRDADSDGYGGTTTSSTSCTAPSGYVATNTDCNDASSAINPAATETCDGVDQNCDGVVDDGTGSNTYYLDADGDGYGVSTTHVTSCSAPSGYATLSTDCLDTSATVYPGATETCNGVDDDCDGTVDDGTSGITTYYRDADGDGYGDASVTTTGCSAPSGYVSTSTDCDDTAATAHPGATEVSYDALDNDCDGYQDEMLAETESDWTILGENSSDGIGTSGVWTAPDLDGDSHPELVIGVPLYNYSSYYTDYGITSFHDVSNSGTDVDVTDGYYEVWGNSYDDQLGQSFAVVDDLDGDGYTEVAFGAYQANASTWTDDDAGIVYLYDVYRESGTDTAYTSYADAAILGSATSGYFGYAQAAGDFDGDGTNELAVGAPGQQTGKGRTYVFFADDGIDNDEIDDTDATFYTTGVSNYDALGDAVAFGDFNDDGYDDLVTCSPLDDDGGSASGTCWVINGSTTRDTSSVSGTTVSSLDTAVITGSAASDGAGYTPNALGVGDLDDDGRDDLAVGVPGYDGYTSGGGGIWVYLGGSLSGSETYATANYLIRGDGTLGNAVTMSDDVTGDGVVDLLGGATTAGSSKGVVYLFAGGQATGTYTLPADQYASWTGKTSGDLFGTTISGLQDLDGDGTLDFAVGAPGNDDGASGAGKVYVLPTYP